LLLFYIIADVHCTESITALISPILDQQECDLEVLSINGDCDIHNF